MELKNKIISFLGDSITEGHMVEDIANCRYDNVIAREYGAIVRNYGVGGSRIAHQSVPSEKPRHDLCFCGRAYDIDPKSDIIVVLGGVNDYLHGDAPVGTPSDETPATFCGGVNFLMKLLKDTFPSAKIVFFTPARCFVYGHMDDRPSSNPIKRADALPLAGYAKIIEESGARFGIPVCRTADKLMLDPGDIEIRRKYLPDGLHFNDAGHALLAKVIAQYLESL